MPLHHFAVDIVSLLAVPLLDAIHADLVGKFKGRTQSPEGGDIGTADPLEAFGTQFGFIPAFGRDCVPQAVDDFIPHIEEPRAFGRLQPLVGAGRVHVAAQIVQIQLHHAGDMRAVYCRQNSFGARQAA